MRMPQIFIRSIRIIAGKFKSAHRIRIKGLFKGLDSQEANPTYFISPNSISTSSLSPSRR